MKIYTKLVLIIGLFTQFNFGQTTVFSDDFNTNTSATWTTSGSIGSSSWSVTRSGDDWGARRNTSPAQLELTNDIGGTTNLNGWVFASKLTSSFSSPFNSTLNLNTGIVTWNFNMRQIRDNPAGFTGSFYGVAFVLAGSSQSADNEGNGYAVVLGQSGETDPIRLVRYSEGLSSSLTNIITSNTTGLSDFGAEYLSIQVTYNPSDDQWELFLRNDGTTSFTDPTTPTLTSQGIATDNYYVGSALLYMGSYWQGSTAANQTAFFDNVSVSVGTNITSPIISLSQVFLTGFNYAQGTGPSAEQSFIISGRNLTANISIASPADYEISTTSGGSFSTDPITLIQSGGIVSSTTIYVRLIAGLSTSAYNNDTTTTSSTNAFNKSVICNGTVTSPPANLPLVENFDYVMGQLTNYPNSSGDNVSGDNWTHVSGTGNFIQVSDGNLNYDNYTVSNTGRRISITSTSISAEDIRRSFTDVNSGKIYASFLVNILDTLGLGETNGNYFAHFTYSILVGSFHGRIYIRAQGENIQFGLRARNDNPTEWISTLFNTGTTYLVVLGYEFVSGDDNNISRLWINPDLSGSEPNADINSVCVASETQVDPDKIDAFGIRQGVDAGFKTPNAIIDGIKIATTWSNAPLPVELSSFSAAVISSAVKLNWKTETEVNNYGFEVERNTPLYPLSRGEAADGTSTSLSVTDWEKIGFVNGNGNSNSPKNYSFVDHNVNTGKYSYRLKQIDNDGQFDYSKAIEVDLGAPKKFELSQNYPNPFNPTTKIRYTILTTPSSSPLVKGRSEVGFVSLKVYDILGNEIVTLVNEEKPAGIYEVEFNSTGVASGIYFYKLQSGSFVQTRKMLVLK